MECFTSTTLKTAVLGTLQNRLIFFFTSELKGASDLQRIASGIMPMLRKLWTECCVGLVFTSPAACK
ncbi:Uncharacterised protein [Chlamydia abortus]|nr:Uncharacterised protein [Chlamydia abortus]